jgi:hypothetical protein
MGKPPVERRKGPDLLVRSLTWANAVALLALIAAFFLTAMAKPEIETFFDRFYNVNLYRRPGWDMELMRYMIALFILSALTGVAGLIVNSRRRRRKQDYIRATLVVCLLASLVGVGLCFQQLRVAG